MPSIQSSTLAFLILSSMLLVVDKINKLYPVTSRNFVKTFLSQIRPDWRVLDLGAGDGRFSQMFVDRGAKVTAVDPKFSGEELSGISIERIKIEDFIEQKSNIKYNAIFLRNILQFLDKNWVIEKLVPWLNENLLPEGVVGIETFYQNPIPAFDKPVSSLYAAQELSGYFKSWQIILIKQYEHFSPDLRGNKRHFFTSDLIVKK